MNTRTRRPAPRDRGMVLITSLLLLLVVTILALAMFRGVGLEGRIAGNIMDKQRALQAAISTEDYAEQWLVSDSSTSISPITGSSCTGSTFSGATAPTICSNLLATSTDAASASVVPWKMGGSPLGYPYDPTTTGAATLFPISTTGGVGNYYGEPTAYIAFLGNDGTNTNAYDYQVDAWSYGGSSATVAVVESVYQIRFIACGTCLGP